jgi:hypothetical protein
VPIAETENWQMTAEVRGNRLVAQLQTAAAVVTTPIVDVRHRAPGAMGVIGHGEREAILRTVEVRRSPLISDDGSLDRRLFDASGVERGILEGEDLLMLGSTVPGWSRLGREKAILLDAYRPERLPTVGDWLLVLELAVS